MEFNVCSLSDRLRTEADAYLFLEELRWGDQPVCPHCGGIRPYFLTPKNGSSRKTRTGAVSERRVWKCADCRKQFSVLTGTVFHGTKIPVRKWVFVIFEMCSSKNGVAAREIERKYDLTPKSAWYMLHRLREAMKRDPLAGLLSGRVVADETWIGGLPRNRHADKRTHTWQGKTDKTPVISLVSRETGEVRSRAIPNVTGETLRGASRARRCLQDPPAYRRLPLVPAHRGRLRQPHGGRSLVRRVRPGRCLDQPGRGVLSQLKRSIDGTHHHVSREHLNRYLAEFDFRFSTCKQSDTVRMQRFARQVGLRRITYRESVSRHA